jgi:hypothetical protein
MRGGGSSFFLSSLITYFHSFLMNNILLILESPIFSPETVRPTMALKITLSIVRSDTNRKQYSNHFTTNS